MTDPITISALRSEYERGALDTQTRILDALRAKYLRDYNSDINGGHLECYCGGCSESLGCSYEDWVPTTFGQPWNPNPRPTRTVTTPIIVDMSGIASLKDDRSALADFVAKLPAKQQAGKLVDWMKQNR